MAGDQYLNKFIRLNIRPDQFGNHDSALLQEHHGRKIKMVEALHGPFYRTDLRLPGRENERNDYVHNGFLVVDPTQDGKILSR